MFVSLSIAIICRNGYNPVSRNCQTPFDCVFLFVSAKFDNNTEMNFTVGSKNIVQYVNSFRLFLIYWRLKLYKTKLLSITYY